LFLLALHVGGAGEFVPSAEAIETAPRAETHDDVVATTWASFERSGRDHIGSSSAPMSSMSDTPHEKSSAWSTLLHPGQDRTG